MNMAQTTKNFNPCRRSLLKLAPVASLAALIGGAVPAAAAPVSEIGARFALWKAGRVEWNAAEEDSPEADAIWDKMTMLENEMVAIPAISASDLAQKVYAYFSGECIYGPIKGELAILAGVV